MIVLLLWTRWGDRRARTFRNPMNTCGKTLQAGARLSVALQEVRAEFIDSSERLAAIAGKWTELWSALPDTTPFQSPDWLIAWWEHYGEGRPLFSFAFWESGQLVGVAPLYIFASTLNRSRRVFVLGTGNTDYADVIFHPEFSARCCSMLVNEIRARGALWDTCEFHRLRRSSPLMRGIGDMPGLRVEVMNEEPCPVLDLNGCAADPMLKKAQHYARKLDETCPFDIEEATPSSVDELLSSLERLHERRWRAKGMPGVLSDPRDRSFHHLVANAFCKSGMVWLYALRLEGQVVAVLYGFRRGMRTYFYLSGFDPEYGHLSAGTVLLGHAIERARATGCRWFDFLQGREAYKYRWGAVDEPVFMKMISRTP